MSYFKPPIEIEEILGRSNQGVTRPFLCRGDNELLYYVKGTDAGGHSLICEWMAGTLARGFGLKVPDFEIAYVPQELIALHPDGRDLGSGPVFASRVAPNLNEILFTQALRVPQAIRRDVIAFDWWIRNADRTLTETGGNPNLLWDASNSELIVIDHNQAFDPEFSSESFLTTHIFQTEFSGLRADLVLMAHYADRMKSTLELWDHAWDAIPAEWLFHDDEQTIPVNFDPVACIELLARCETEELWRLP
ncbi:HipA family kinase [Xanthomonas arboricola]|uniref:HipA family kinase n=1 Tax=Xanthomonas arboricola TaxID=56448 RepID=UPI003EB913BB